MHVESVLLINFGKWILFARADQSEFFISSNDSSLMPNQLPIRISMDEADKIVFIGHSLLRLNGKNVDLKLYRTEATKLIQELKLQKGELDEHCLPCPSQVRFNWRNLRSVLNKLENVISSYTWQVFIEQGNLIKELGTFKQIFFLTR